MPNPCFARTNSQGGPYGLGSLARETSHLRHIATKQNREWDMPDSFIELLLSELKDLRKSNDVAILIDYLERHGANPEDLIRYQHHRATHYIKYNDILYSCRHGLIREKKFK